MHIKLLVFSLVCSFSLSAETNSSEEFPGGEGSVSDFSVQAFSHPSSGLRGEARRAFTVGNSFFNTVWVAGPASTTARDGLGPMYNAVSCSSCHFKDGRGRGLPENPGKVDISLLFRIRVIGAGKEVIPHPAYGEQIQPQGIEGVPGEATPVVSYSEVTVTFPDGETAQLQKPQFQFISPNYGPLAGETIISPRVAPQMIGLGLLENISEKDILKNEDPDDADGDGISGRANRVFSLVSNAVVPGRFGWKAAKATLIEQNAAAFNGDIGITSSYFPEEECTSLQTECLQRKTIQDIEDDRLRSVTTYSQLLAVPARRNFREESVTRGKEVFQKIGCTSCHTPSYTTGTNSSVSVLNNQKIYPYTDLLLHDMGPDLADDTRNVAFEGEATTREWRTPPLWGLGLVKTVNGHTRFLHDGRARNLEEAVLWHGGEAKKSRDEYVSLSKIERQNLIDFLNSL